MKSGDAHNIEGWMEDRIEAYLDNELPATDKSRFEKLIQDDDRWEAELALAVNIRDTLRATPSPECPPEIYHRIIKDVRWHRQKAWLTAIRQWFWSPGMLAWKPALAVATVLVVISTMMIKERPTPQQPEIVSEAEVEQALEEVKWALGYVSKTGRLTGSSILDALGPLREGSDDASTTN